MSQLLVSNGFLPSDPCYSFIGTYGSQSLYVSNVDCVSSNAETFTADADELIDVPEDIEMLYWIDQPAIDEELLTTSKPENPWQLVDDVLSSNASYGKRAIDASVLYRTETASLLSLRDSKDVALDSILASYHKGYAISFPIQAAVAVPQEDIDRIVAILNGLEHSDVVASFVESLSADQLRADVTWLTGEDPTSPVESRNSLHTDALIAAQWIAEQIEGTGATCELRSFRMDYCPNVICRYSGTGNTDSFILLSAHYDSRGSSGNIRAPGGNDDGSGTAAILSIARAIGSNSVSFKSDVELVLFGGEEQGLLGSAAYAQELRDANADIILMLQADMIAYHVPGESMQLGQPVKIGTPEVAQLVAKVAELYSPELAVGFTPTCCGDHQSFHEQGYAATEVSERAGPIADPEYHTSNDLSNRSGYDFDQLRSIAKVQFATLLHAAGFN